MDEKAISKAVETGVIEALTKHGIVDPKTHEAHHRWCKTKIEKEKSCSVRKRKIIDGVIGAVSISVAVGILVQVGQLIRHWMTP